ncbi:uncharacterized protein E0L32_010168 [Thyridium curvatum]|uniref:Uncharacterized protein n=1 Tax=Thyridium curvatum TaxID=1093900 RepID=A0A507AT62_9PEZI|nr:uncharacterized protein E0L32_010168 [Thyridium curvatum]TPX08101.1 hypothetical protein E0L32_010168 [Thyridium curvatum]
MSGSRYTAPAIAAATVLGGTIYFRGRSRPVANVDPAQQVADKRPAESGQPKQSGPGLSGALQAAAGSGGASSRTGGPQADPKDTRVASSHDSTPTKRGPSGEQHHHDAKQPGTESGGA